MAVLLTLQPTVYAHGHLACTPRSTLASLGANSEQNPSVLPLRLALHLQWGALGSPDPESTVVPLPEGY